MSFLWPRTLRGWFSAIAVAALAASLAGTLLLLSVQDGLLRSSLHQAETFQRVTALIRLTDRADAPTRQAIALATANDDFRVGFSREPAVPQDKTNPELAQVLSRIAALPAAKVRAAWDVPPSQATSPARATGPGVIMITRDLTDGAPSHSVTTPADKLAQAIQQSIAQQIQTRPSGGQELPRTTTEPGVSVVQGSRSGVTLVSATSSFGDRSRTPLSLSVQLSDGAWLNVRTLPAQGRSTLLPLLAASALTALLAGFGAYWAAGRVARPLAGLTEAAERLGRGERDAVAPTDGPDDVARAGRAFNAMATRLNTTIEDQRALLNAVGHDLRTPIATMRIRVEQAADPELKARMLATLAEMEGLTAATLAAARGGDSGEDVVKLDLSSLVEAVCDDLADAGLPVSLGALAPLRVNGRPGELRRAVRNLVENAVRYGGVARAAALSANGEAVVSVDDDGPGIPDNQMAEVFKPFVRLEQSRNLDTGGHGLGLTIANAIALRHGGRIELANRNGGGLSARLILPLSQ